MTSLGVTSANQARRHQHMRRCCTATGFWQLEGGRRGGVCGALLLVHKGRKSSLHKLFPSSLCPCRFRHLLTQHLAEWSSRAEIARPIYPNIFQAYPVLFGSPSLHPARAFLLARFLELLAGVVLWWKDFISRHQPMDDISLTLCDRSGGAPFSFARTANTSS